MKIFHFDIFISLFHCRKALELLPQLQLASQRREDERQSLERRLALLKRDIYSLREQNYNVELVCSVREQLTPAAFHAYWLHSRDSWHACVMSSKSSSELAPGISQSMKKNASQSGSSQTDTEAEWRAFASDLGSDSDAVQSVFFLF
jgi:hypothetical protein